MGYGADWIAENECNELELRMRIEDEASLGIWTTKDGERISVRDMTTNHIMNVVRYIQQIDYTDMYMPWIKVFEAELTRRELLML